MTFVVAREPTTSSTRIAWIGNSYTSANALPALVTALLTMADVYVERTNAVTTGGALLSAHSADHRVGAMLREDWDIVVLQDQSQVPGGFHPEAYESSLTALDWFSPFLVGRSRCVLFSTWGHREASFHQGEQVYADYIDMQINVTSGVVNYAQRLREHGVDVVIAPVGDAFRHIYSMEAEPLAPASLFSSLYSADGSHPSAAGSYLAACVILLTLQAQAERDEPPGRQFNPMAGKVLPTGYIPSEIASMLSSDEAARLRSVATEVVDEALRWHARRLGAGNDAEKKPKQEL